MNDIKSLDGFQPSTFRLTAGRANRLRHREEDVARTFSEVWSGCRGLEQLKFLHVIVKRPHGLLVTFTLADFELRCQLDAKIR